MIAVFSILFIYTIKWNGISGQNYRNTIKSDGIGYYQYIPSILEGKLSNQVENGTYLIKIKNARVVNKYFIGTSIMVAPFVLPVYITQKIACIPIDFYSEYYQKAYSIAALFYLLIGLIAFRKLLILYNIEPKVIAFSIFAIFAGTNLAYYSLLEPSMSHVYSFGIISLFIYNLKEFSIKQKPSSIIKLSILLGIIVLIRPVNVVIILIIPFIVNTNYRSIIAFIKAKPSYFVYSLLIFVILLSIQSLAWWLQSGKVLLWSYSNEGFYFSKPEIINFLFSFRKGAFIYTPIILLSIIAFSIKNRNNLKQILTALLFFAGIVYILSSWWNWYYGDSFGSRVMVEFMTFIILLFAIAVNQIKAIKQRKIILLASLLIMLNIFQTYQYYYQIISPFDMNYEKYKYVFAKYGEENRGILGYNSDIIQYHQSDPIQLIDTNINTNNNSSKFEYIIKANELMDYKSSFLIFSCEIINHNSDLSKAFWQISYNDSLGNSIIATQLKLNEIPLCNNESRKNNYSFRLPKPINSRDTYKLRIVNPQRANFDLEYVKLKILGIKK